MAKGARGSPALGAEPGETSLKRLAQPEGSRAASWRKALMTRAGPQRWPRAGRAAEAASGRGLGMAGCVWLWATAGVSFSSLPTASKTTELAAELGGGVKIESQLHTTICPGWL